MPTCTYLEVFFVLTHLKIKLYFNYNQPQTNPPPIIEPIIKYKIMKGVPDHGWGRGTSRNPRRRRKKGLQGPVWWCTGGYGEPRPYPAVQLCSTIVWLRPPAWEKAWRVSYLGFPRLAHAHRRRNVRAMSVPKTQPITHTWSYR